ncbi:MAG: A/G-specific adenine glycosylase [Bacteroidales bacterium]|nr:A/G-specific adenine glycosylase [Bacteroidales bacterium]
MNKFTKILLNWFDEHQRVLPWRGETDPYKIWVSEIILQQTRVVQGISYYQRFVEKFPDVTALASADEAEVLKLWQGLGYYSRARNMHAAAQFIRDHHHGVFPSDYKSIRSLKGIGDYTAAAIGSIAFGLPCPAVDGNVLRFVARYTGLYDNIAVESTRRHVEALCGQWLPAECPGTFNQAMMEMGAICCVPKSPDCSQCPFVDQCFAFQHGQVDQLPVKEHAVKIKRRYFNYFIFLSGGRTLLQRREADDIWKNLYEFPLVESPSSHFDVDRALASFSLDWETTPELVWETRHVLTHRHIFARFYVLNVKSLPPVLPHQVVVPLENLRSYAVAKVTEIAINKLFG